MAKYCTECGTKVTPSMKYCPECGKKISKRSKSKSKDENSSKDKESAKKKTKSASKKSSSKKSSSKRKSKKKQSKKGNSRFSRKLVLGLTLFLIGFLLLALYFTVLLPDDSRGLIDENGLIKISPESILELTNNDVASKEGYFCSIKSGNEIYYIKESEIKSLNGLDKPFLAKVKLKKLDNNQEIYAIVEVYDLDGNKL